jgi:hypothetical protein
MIFRRNKPDQPSESRTPVLRGRDSAENRDNPLARRFHPEDEPDTIDLQQPEGFNEEPGTADLAAKSAAGDSAGSVTATPAGTQLGVVFMVVETGKFYVQPGSDEDIVYLGDEPVLAPTELRPGDRIKAGKYELCLLRQGQE